LDGYSLNNPIVAASMGDLQKGGPGQSHGMVPFRGLTGISRKEDRDSPTGWYHSGGSRGSPERRTETVPRDGTIQGAHGDLQKGGPGQAHGMVMDARGDRQKGEPG
jgi:hypothetical protein